MSTVGDCECREGTRLRQEVNALSSGAYLVAAAVLADDVRRGRADPTVGLLAGLLAAEGVGSVAYHGGSGELAQFSHDLPLIGMVGYFGGWAAGRLAGGSARGAVAATVATVGAGGALWLRSHASVNLAVAVGAAAVVGCEQVARTRGLPSLWAPPVGAMALASGVAWVAGHGSSPLCRPRSRLQPHALWHVGSAAVAVAWARRAASVDPPVQR